MTEPVYHFPSDWDRFGAWGEYVEVVDRATGQVLEKVCRVDAEAGTVQFERWNETTGAYDVVVQERVVDLRLKAVAPDAAREWFKLPVVNWARKS